MQRSFMKLAKAVTFICKILDYNHLLQRLETTQELLVWLKNKP